MDAFTRENFPAEFENQIFDPVFAEIGPIYSSKDLNKLVLKNEKFRFHKKMIYIEVKPCNKTKVAAGCASKTEIGDFLEQHSFNFFRIQNFINYENFDDLPINQIP